MKLFELAFACYIYKNMTGYDKAYLNLRDVTSGTLDLSVEEDKRNLLRWLNEWGCRQFAIEYHSAASQEIGEWYAGNRNILPDNKRNLLQASNEELEAWANAYGDLATKTASLRAGNQSNKIEVQIGPTGAAKILFAMSPNVFPPWDDPIRKDFGFDGSAASYLIFLKEVYSELLELEKECIQNNCKIVDIPQILDRAESSLVKLIDEFYWVTISRKCPVPSRELVESWLKWLE